MKKDTAIVLNNAEALFGSSELVSIQPEQLEDNDALFVWSLFDAMEKELVKKRKDVFRKHLLKLAEEKGIQNAKGSFEYAPPQSDGKITKQARKGKASLDLAAAEKLLGQKDLFDQAAEVSVTLSLRDFEEVLEALRNHDEELQSIFMQGATPPKLNEAMIEAMVTMGSITMDELQSISLVGEPTYALKVKRPSVVEQMIKGGEKT